MTDPANVPQVTDYERSGVLMRVPCGAARVSVAVAGVGYMKDTRLRRDHGWKLENGVHAGPCKLPCQGHPWSRIGTPLCDALKQDYVTSQP